MKIHAVVLILSFTLLTGCIVGETDHRLYIDPSGAVTWVVLERDLKSTAGSAAERQSQETALMGDASVARHPVARAFDLLHPETVCSRVLRPVRPMTIWTEGCFDSIDNLARSVLFQLNVTGVVELTTRDRLTTLSIRVDPGQDAENLLDDDILALAEDVDHYRFVLTSGRFVEAQGFEIFEDGAVAVPVQQSIAEDEPLLLSLSWQS